MPHPVIAHGVGLLIHRGSGAGFSMPRRLRLLAVAAIASAAWDGRRRRWSRVSDHRVRDRCRFGGVARNWQTVIGPRVGPGNGRILPRRSFTRNRYRGLGRLGLGQKLIGPEIVRAGGKGLFQVFRRLILPAQLQFAKALHAQHGHVPRRAFPASASVSRASLHCFCFC